MEIHHPSNEIIFNDKTQIPSPKCNEIQCTTFNQIKLFGSNHLIMFSNLIKLSLDHSPPVFYFYLVIKVLIINEMKFYLLTRHIKFYILSCLK